MPPDERDPADRDAPVPGEWDESGSPAPEVVAELVIEPPAAPDGAAVHAEKVFCRRCGETSYPVDKCCPWCGLWLVGAPPLVAPVHVEPEPEDDWDTEVARRKEARRRGPPPPPIHPGVVIGVSYALLIGSLVVGSVMAYAEHLTRLEDAYGIAAVVEILDAVLTVTALALVWRSARQKLPEGTQLITWGAAFPILFVLLCLDVAYSTFLQELFGLSSPKPMGVSFATVMLVCVQPAIVEELFFRQMVLGVFRKWVNVHAAVWITAGLFAFAHLGNPLGMPYLALAGAVFCYARVLGGLPLAMVMHFVHNFAVIAYEAWK